jgi:hypothetical protein
MDASFRRVACILVLGSCERRFDVSTGAEGAGIVTVGQDGQRLLRCSEGHCDPNLVSTSDRDHVLEFDAFPDPGWEFGYWRAGTGSLPCGDDASFDISLESVKASYDSADCMAHFYEARDPEPDPRSRPTLRLFIEGEGVVEMASGSRALECAAACDLVIDPAEGASMTAIAGGGWRFDHWDTHSGGTLPCTVAPDPTSADVEVVGAGVADDEDVIACNGAFVAVEPATPIVRIQAGASPPVGALATTASDGTIYLPDWEYIMRYSPGGPGEASRLVLPQGFAKVARMTPAGLHIGGSVSGYGFYALVDQAHHAMTAFELLDATNAADLAVDARGRVAVALEGSGGSAQVLIIDGSSVKALSMDGFLDGDTARVAWMSDGGLLIATRLRNLDGGGSNELLVVDGTAVRWQVALPVGVTCILPLADGSVAYGGAEAIGTHLRGVVGRVAADGARVDEVSIAPTDSVADVMVWDLRAADDGGYWVQSAWGNDVFVATLGDDLHLLAANRFDVASDIGVAPRGLSDGPAGLAVLASADDVYVWYPTPDMELFECDPAFGGPIGSSDFEVIDSTFEPRRSSISVSEVLPRYRRYPVAGIAEEPLVTSQECGP